MAQIPEILENPLRQKIIDILMNNGVTDEVNEVKMFEPEHLKGEHMATATFYCSAEFKDPEVKEKNLFVKRFHNSDAHIEWGKRSRIMEKEAEFYNKFLPRLRKFCEEYNGCQNLLNFFPKCFYADEEMIVLENLVLDDNWIMLDKEEGQDMETAKLVLGNLAKFHAACYAFIQREYGGRGKFMEEWEVVCFENSLRADLKSMNQFFENGINTCVSILKRNPVEGDDEALQTLERFKGKIFKICLDLLKHKDEDKFYTVNHGDCWNNNMLLKKDPKSSRNFDQIFIDFQTTRLGSPGLDIYMYLSVKPGVRRDNLDILLRHYYVTSVDTLRKLDVKCPWTYEEFLDDYKDKGQYGFFFALVLNIAMGAMKYVDPNEMTGDPGKTMELWDNAIKRWIGENPQKAVEISKEIVQVLGEYKKLHKRSDHELP